MSDLVVAAAPQPLDAQHLAWMLAAAAGVTGGRQALLAVWPDFAAATDASNRQVRCVSWGLKMLLNETCHWCRSDCSLPLQTKMQMQSQMQSQTQVLAPLAPYDLLWLAALPGISEELLFRGALIPALSPDWCAFVSRLAHSYHLVCLDPYTTPQTCHLLVLLPMCICAGPV